MTGLLFCVCLDWTAKTDQENGEEIDGCSYLKTANSNSFERE